MKFPQSSWTDALAQKLGELWPNHSAGQICEIFARDHGETFTRNQIIGKAHRLGIVKVGVEPKPVKEKVDRPSRNVGRRKPPGVKLPSLPFVPRVVEATPRHLTLYELTDEVCKYECSNQEDASLYTFCGNPQFKGSYCAKHAAIVYVAPRAPTSTFRERAVA